MAITKDSSIACITTLSTLPVQDRPTLVNVALCPIMVSWHYCDVILGAVASPVTSLTTVYSSVHSGVDQRKHQSSAPLAFVWGIHRWLVNCPHKCPVTRKMFPFDDVIMERFGTSFIQDNTFDMLSAKYRPFVQICSVLYVLKYLNPQYSMISW